MAALAAQLLPPGRRTPLPVSLAAIALLSACASEAPLDEGAMLEELQARADPALVAKALELADLGPLSIERPVFDPKEVDYDDGPYWHACALLHDPDTRAQRLELVRLRALDDWSLRAGNPELEAEVLDVTDFDEEIELKLTFDLLGLFGSGRAAAARGLARARVREALAGLEAAVWAARLRIDRARLAVAGALLLAEELARIEAEAEADARRADLLARRGWVPPADVDEARQMLAMVKDERHEAERMLAVARVDLAATAGLLPGAEPVARVTPSTLLRLRPPRSAAADDAQALLRAHPVLRVQSLRYALSEAEVRAAAANAWPRIEIGPRITIEPDDVLPGGLLKFDLPLPGAIDARIDAAVAARGQQRIALEAALTGQLGRVRKAASELDHRRQTVLPVLEPGEAAAARRWQAARARFQIDATALGDWSSALYDRVQSLRRWLAGRADLLRSELDLAEARGPAGWGE